MTTPNGEYVSPEDALRAFGWEATDTFKDRYLTDPWVYNLTNALCRTLTRVRELEAQNARSGAQS